MDALHVRLEAFSASYPYPFLRSGRQLSMPAPPLCSILGHIGACAGRAISPGETLIGFEFVSEGRAVDLERTRRLMTSKTTGRLAMNPEQGVAKREFHVRPRLDLYLTNTALAASFEYPTGTPCLGRSQDLAWISFVRKIEIHAVEVGEIEHTMIPFPNFQVGGQVLPPLADYFVNDRLGYTRIPGRLSRYQFVPNRCRVKAAPEFPLYHPSDSEDELHAVFLHRPG
jgi:CRISPR-associated protein Cas5t